MRSISATSLAKLAQRKGTEPINIVEITWADNLPNSLYGEKAYSDLNIEGRIISIANLESSVNIFRSSNNQSIEITLDDSDGVLKQIFNNQDIHKRTVWVWQWFDGIPYTEKFLLFRGQISSPISWKEGDRTISFDVLSEIEDNEVGFSPEEGLFDFIPDNLIGQAWPLIFGTVQKVPGILLDSIPHGSGSVRGGSAADSVLQDPIGITDPTLDPHTKQGEATAEDAAQLALLYFIGYLQASGAARRAGELGDFDDISRGNGTYSGLAQQYLQLGNQYLLESQKIFREMAALKAVKRVQDGFQSNEVGITNGELFAQNQEIALDINGSKVVGKFTSDTFHVLNVEHPEAPLVAGFVDPGSRPELSLNFDDPHSPEESPYLIPRNKFFWADSGTPIRLHISQTTGSSSVDTPVRYVVSAGMFVTVNTVYAKRTTNGIKNMVPVPSNYYQVLNVNFGSLPVTLVYMSKPLSGRNEGWDDDLWFTATSSIGPNTIDIMKWIIDNFTNFTYDNTTFNYVHTKLAPYPSHFALLDKRQALDLLQDIAFQARCILWLNNGVFYIKYLPEEVSSVDTITADDILNQTLEIGCTETEELVTKFIAKWKPDYSKDKEYKIIYRYHINKYGVQDKEFEYFIYNQQQLVEKSATFWLLRLANTYKLVTFRTTISKLNLEPLDTITLNPGAGIIANGPIKCLIESTSFDSENYEIEFKVWVPVRFGEMVQYDFAWPANLSAQFVFPTADDVERGNAGSPTIGSTAALPTNTGNANVEKPLSGDTGNGGQLRVTHRPYDWGSDPAYIADSGNTAPTITNLIDSTRITPQGRPSGVDEYNYKLYKTQVKQPQPITTVTLPGKVNSGSGDTYVVDVYFKGIENSPSQVRDVKQFQIDPNETIPAGTACLVSRVVWEDKKGAKFFQYVMQLAVWL